MPPIHKNHLEWLKAWHVDLVDTRSVDDTSIRSLAYLFYHLIGEHPEYAVDVHGLSVRQTGTRCTFVLKATVAGVRRVAYITEQTPTACVRTVVRKWLNDTLEWHDDRYA